MQDTELQLLAQKYLNGKATDEEVRRLMEWYDDFDKDLLVNVPAGEQDSREKLQESILKRLQQSLSLQGAIAEDTGKTVALRTRRFIRRSVYAAASVVLIMVSFGLYRMFNGQQNTTKTTTRLIQPVPIVPGGDKAVLTLSDGSHITLDSVANGVIAMQGNARVIHAGGQLTYEADAKAVAPPGTSQVYNTISTPLGGQYQLVLPDGSKIWLNAGSSVEFPTVFSGIREISVTGEVYLEVATQYGAQQQKVPFIVTVKPSGQKIEVVGTAFNINAYTDEPEESITLVEGKIRVHTDANRPEANYLGAGQQFVVNRTKKSRNNIRQLDPAAIENVMAWKNQMFRFGNTDLTHIMRQVARWYNVEIVYDKSFEGEFFSGSIPRHSSVTEVLHKLELTGTVKFEIHERKILVKNVSQ